MNRRKYCERGKKCKKQHVRDEERKNHSGGGGQCGGVHVTTFEHVRK